MSKPVINMEGAVVGWLTVLTRATNKGRKIQWRCICQCGLICIVQGGNLRSGHTQSCGHCNRANEIEKRSITHGESSREKRSAEYRTWCNMVSRCTDRSRPDFKDYGGRGITVCKRWFKFENFLADMGRRPSPTHSLDRYPNNNSGYKPTNCRWATATQQAANRRPKRRSKIR